MTFIQWLIQKGYIPPGEVDIILRDLSNPSVDTLFEMYLAEGYGDD
jgi:hypothetical protein